MHDFSVNRKLLSYKGKRISIVRLLVQPSKHFKRFNHFEKGSTFFQSPTELDQYFIKAAQYGLGESGG